MAFLMRVFISLATTTMLLKLAMGANITVGGPDGGWDLATDLQAWAASQKFLVGDTLTFVYLSPFHDVLEVSEADYTSCGVSNPVKAHSGGLTVISLTSAGKRYFICGTAGHCSAGMKVEIDTLPSPTTATPATPPRASPSTPPPSKTPSTPPPAANSPASSPPASSPPSKAPSTSPSVSPKSAPSKSTRPSPLTSPSSSPANSPAPSSPSPTGSTTPPPPSSSANKNSYQTSLTIGFGFVFMMILS